MKTLTYQFPAESDVVNSAQVGVVASGDLEILVEDNGTPDHADIRVRTSIEGFDAVWEKVLRRFFSHQKVAGRWEINDYGATPGVVTLRLQQAAQRALEGARS